MSETELEKLTARLKDAALSLVQMLLVIQFWDEDGAPDPMPEEVRDAFAKAQDLINQCRYRVGQLDKELQYLEKRRGKNGR